MRFPNAYAGVKKIYTSELLELLSTIFIVIAAVAAAVTESSGGIDAASASKLGGIAISFIIGLILALIATILQIVGLSQASKDEPKYFRIAFCIAIIVLILTAISGFASGADKSNSIIDDLPNLLDIFIFIFTVSGISELSRKMNRQDMVSFGTKILTLEVILTVIAFIVGIIPAGDIAGVLAVVSALLALIVVVVYLIYLAKAKKMLEG